MTKQNNETDQTFWKILTHDFRPPLQGGEAVWGGKTLPFKLNGVTLDTSNNECAAGWNFVDSIEAGFNIAGMWRTGRPSQVLVVHPSQDKIHRGNKWRASQLTIERLATNLEIESGIERFSECFGAFKSEMSHEQILWREALSRPINDINKVTKSLEIALKKRGLDWKLKQFDAARDARDAWDAWDALTVNYASLDKWITYPHDLLTTGIRDAFLHGLEIAIPVSDKTLGFAISEASNLNTVATDTATN